MLVVRFRAGVEPEVDSDADQRDARARGGEPRDALRPLATPAWKRRRGGIEGGRRLECDLDALSLSRADLRLGDHRYVSLRPDRDLMLPRAHVDGLARA